LHFVAQHGAPDDIIKALIDVGADLEAKDYKGKSPADVARQYKQTATASYIEQFYQPTKSANFIV
jgi:hypothetical protein